MTYVVVGDAMLDVTVRIDRPLARLARASDTPARISTQPGGSAANAARWLAWAGEATWFAGALGDDLAGAQVRAALEAAGARLAVATVPGVPTGACVALVEPGGERTMLPDRGANAALAETLPAVVRLLDDRAHVHLSGYSILGAETREAALAVLDAAAAAGATVSVDCSSAAPLAEALGPFREALAPGIAVLLANADEATVLGGIEAMLALAEVAVVKRGAGAAEAMARDGSGAARPPLAVDVLDATGAGDAFAAGFLPAWRAGLALADALDAGHRLAGLACGRVGAGPPAP